MNKIFSMRLLFFWIDGKIDIDSRFVNTNVRNSIMGFIPAGKDVQNIPLKNISSSTVSTYYNLKAIVFGIILILASFSLFTKEMSVLGVVFIIVGVLLILSAIKTKLIIEKAGTPYVISVPFYEKSKIKEINEFIHKYLKGDTDKTDLNLFFDKKEKQPNESD